MLDPFNPQQQGGSLEDALAHEPAATTGQSPQMPQQSLPTGTMQSQPGGVKAWLSTVLGGIGDAALKQAGLMTSGERRQQQFTNQIMQQQAAAQEEERRGIAQWRQSQAQYQQYQMSPVPVGDDIADRFGIEHGSTMPQFMYGILAKAHAQAQAREQAAQTTGQFGLQRAQVTAGGKLGLNPYNPQQSMLGGQKVKDAFPGVDLGTLGEQDLNPLTEGMARGIIGGRNQAKQGSFIGGGMTSTRQVIKDTPSGPQTVNLTSTSRRVPANASGGNVAPAGGTGRTSGNVARPIVDASGQPLPPPAAQDAKWVTWDENGRTVAGPRSMARQNGAENPAEVPAQQIRDITNARHAVTLMTKQGDPGKPETQGVLQLIDSLDKDGKLGVLASRWNSFMTNKVGTSPGDDPRIITLINKNMLGDTATMLSHFGASGGRSPQMLQHFMDLANAHTMDAPTLRYGVKAMADYMQDRAMVPGAKSAPGSSGGFDKSKFPFAK